MSTTYISNKNLNLADNRQIYQLYFSNTLTKGNAAGDYYENSDIFNDDEYQDSAFEMANVSISFVAEKANDTINKNSNILYLEDDFGEIYEQISYV